MYLYIYKQRIWKKCSFDRAFCLPNKCALTNFLFKNYQSSSDTASRFLKLLYKCNPVKPFLIFNNQSSYSSTMMAILSIGFAMVNRTVIIFLMTSLMNFF